MNVAIVGCGLIGRKRAAALTPDDAVVGAYDVVPASAVNVDVDEARYYGKIAPIVIARGCRNLDFVRAAHRNDLFGLYQNNGVRNFISRRKSTSSKNR